MRERLIELIQDSVHGCARHWAEVIADHLIENGVIVPPCKVGQTVYCIRYDKARKPFVKPLAVLTVTVWGKGKFTVFTTKEEFWCATAFPTREEAEKALKGGAE